MIGGNCCLHYHAAQPPRLPLWEGFGAINIQPCDAEAVKECVAQTFADAGFMHRVVVLDSLLYHPDSTESHILTQAEVNALCHELEVEMLYSIDYACLIYNPTSRFVTRPLNAYLCSRIYTPDGDSIRGSSVMNNISLQQPRTDFYIGIRQIGEHTYQ